MRRYIHHIRESKAPHERRQHALRVAGVVTLAVFGVWLGTLGTRLADAPVASEQNSLNTAAAGTALEVSQTSLYSY